MNSNWKGEALLIPTSENLSISTNHTLYNENPMMDTHIFVHTVILVYKGTYNLHFYNHRHWQSDFHQFLFMQKVYQHYFVNDLWLMEKYQTSFSVPCYHRNSFWGTTAFLCVLYSFH